jgi:hypothetical protein
MQRPGPGKIATLLPALIWNPHNSVDGDSLYQTLLRGDYAATLTRDLSPFIDSIDNFHIFVMAYYGVDSLELTWPELESFYPAIMAFLQGGGSLFWYGAGAFNTICFYAPALNDYFGLLLYGMPHSISYLTGLESALYGPMFADIDSLVCGGGSFDIESACGWAEAEVLVAPGSAEVGLICQVGETRTLMSDFSWAVLNDTGLNTRVDLIQDVMEWLSGAVAIDEPEPLPTEFSLSQNYPNPFNATTTIEYALPVGGNVRLQVYDITGRVVATLVNGAMPAGYHQVVWDAKGMSSGLYFLRIQAGEFAETKKMALVK